MNTFFFNFEEEEKKFIDLALLYTETDTYSPKLHAEPSPTHMVTRTHIATLSACPACYILTAKTIPHTSMHILQLQQCHSSSKIQLAYGG